MLLSGELRHLTAEDELHASHAAAYGAAIGFGGADPKLKRHTRKLIALAYPEVLDG